MRHLFLLWLLMLGPLTSARADNLDFDVEHYRIELRVDMRENQFRQARVAMTGRALRPLEQVVVQFRGLELQSVSFEGRSLAYHRDGARLQVTLPRQLTPGTDFRLEFGYRGKPELYPSNSAPIGLGWRHFGQGAAVFGQPDGASAWMPVHEVLGDKARYDFFVEVEKPWTVVANGQLQEITQLADGQRFHWRAPDPMASYLASIQIGRFVRQKLETPGGLLVDAYFPESKAEAARSDLANTGPMLAFLSRIFGPYPFQSYGVTVLDTSLGGVAFEAQTRPLFESDLVQGDGRYQDFFVHELAHQWFGNSITLRSWSDIWLNEGLATYSEWLWAEHLHGKEALQKKATEAHEWLINATPFVLGSPPADQLFSGQVYLKSASLFHALRLQLGDDTFFSLLRAYYKEFAGGWIDTEEFIRFSEQHSGKRLRAFFKSWLDGPELPAE